MHIEIILTSNHLTSSLMDPHGPSIFSPLPRHPASPKALPAGSSASSDRRRLRRRPTLNSKWKDQLDHRPVCLVFWTSELLGFETEMTVFGLSSAWWWCVFFSSPLSQLNFVQSLCFVFNVSLLFFRLKPHTRPPDRSKGFSGFVFQKNHPHTTTQRHLLAARVCASPQL